MEMLHFSPHTSGTHRREENTLCLEFSLPASAIWVLLLECTGGRMILLISADKLLTGRSWELSHSSWEADGGDSTLSSIGYRDISLGQMHSLSHSLQSPLFLCVPHFSPPLLHSLTLCTFLYILMEWNTLSFLCLIQNLTSRHFSLHSRWGLTVANASRPLWEERSVQRLQWGCLRCTLHSFSLLYSLHFSATWEVNIDSLEEPFPDGTNRKKEEPACFLLFTTADRRYIMTSTFSLAWRVMLLCLLGGGGSALPAC